MVSRVSLAIPALQDTQANPALVVGLASLVTLVNPVSAVGLA